MSEGVRRVVVIGAGPSGLAAAHRCVEIARERGEPVEVHVLEASDRPGGAIGTDEVGGFRIERGADGFITDKPALIDLAGRLGIAGRLVRTRPAGHGAYVVKGGRLLPIPAGFSMMAPTRLGPFLASPLLSRAGKARALLEPLVPRGSGGDESLASFVRRRFGPELLERLAQPLVGGVYGADPEKLSLRATMPRFIDEERASGSVTLGLMRKARAKGAAEAAQGARYGLFASFDHGMQVLVDSLVASLPEGALRLGSTVLSLEPEAGGEVRVRTSSGELLASHVVLALGARPASGLLSSVQPRLAEGLGAIEHGSAALVNMGFAHRVLPSWVDGYGVVVPEVEGRPSIAATFASRKWPGRAPEGRDLIRVFLGERFAGSPDDECLKVALSELRSLFGVDEAPAVVVVRRYQGAMPHYHVGHLDRVAEIERLASAVPWLSLAGNALRGVGLPDAVRSGEAAAARAMGEHVRL